MIAALLSGVAGEVYSHHSIGIYNLFSEFLIESRSLFVKLLNLQVTNINEPLFPVILILKYDRITD